MTLKNLLNICAFLLIIKSSAQIGIGTNSPNNSSVLDLSSTTKGLLLPRISLTSSTDVTSIPNPVNSLLVYNTSTIEDVTTGFYFWATNKWVKITTELEGSWKNNTTKEFATTNNQDIYQLGKVGIGNSIVNYPLDFGETSAVNLNDETGKKIALSSLDDGRAFWGLGASEGSLNIFAGDSFSGGKGGAFAVFTNDHEFILVKKGAISTYPSSQVPYSDRIFCVTPEGDLWIPGIGTSSQSTWSTTSDVRSKKNIKPFTSGLNEIMKIEPITFNYNGRFDTTNDGMTHTGILAQDLQKILPNSISEKKDSKGEEYLQLKGTDQILYSLVNAVKEQQIQISTNRENLKTLETKMERQRKEIANLKEQLAKSTLKQ